MLVLTRKAKEEIRIGNDITVTIVRVKGQSVRIGINAPDHVHIMRSELANQDEVKRQDAAGTPSKARSESQTSSSEEPTVTELTVDELKVNERTVSDLTANSPLMKRLENQLNSRSKNDAPNQQTTSRGRFQSPLGSTDSFSRVFGRGKLDRAHQAIEESDND